MRLHLSATLLAAVALPGRGILPGEPGEPLFLRGHMNADERYDVADPVSLFVHLFRGGPPPPCLDAADANDDGVLDLTDGIQVLSHLFRGGPPPPPPGPDGPCRGPDPTPDALGCAGGAPAPASPPLVQILLTRANAPGVRQRSRIALPLRKDLGAFVVDAGEPVALIVVATSSRATGAPFQLADPQTPTSGNPHAVTLTCDRDLGPTRAGENLAQWLLRDLDPWKDEIYLVEHAGLILGGQDLPLPAVGRTTFSVSVTDTNCSVSPLATATLEVTPSEAPAIRAWLERGARPSGTPVAHDPGTGNARLDGSGGLLVLEARGGDPELLADASFGLTAAPAPPGPADLAGIVATDAGRTFLRLGSEGLELAPGDTTFTISLRRKGAELRSFPFVVEVPVSHEDHLQPIWDEHCTGCHERPELEGGLELVRPDAPPGALWRNLVNVYAAGPRIDSSAPYLVRPFEPLESYLLHKLQGTQLEASVAGRGEQMPANAPALPPALLHRVESWIRQGAAR